MKTVLGLLLALSPLCDLAAAPLAAAAAPAVPNAAAFPIYHYKAASGSWFGDVNGPIYHDGWFHIFFQWRMPDNPKICWGHARSRDLIDWEHLPVAIAPRGAQGSWSGATVVTAAGPRILFTSDGQQSGSRGSRDLIHWQPMNQEPVMPRSLHESKGVKISGWRDPFIWKHQGAYYACLGGSAAGQGYVSLYKTTSEELDDWEFVGPLFIHPDSPDNACPNFFKVGNKWVLLMSRHRPHVEDWFVGNWNPETLRFEPDTHGMLGYNEATFATQGLCHPDGRVIYWNTMHQWRGANKPLDWPGCASLPRELSIAADNTLRIKPLAELARLRGEHFHAEAIALSDATKILEGLTGDALEIRLTLQSQGADSFGLVVRRSADGTRGMEIRYRGTLTIDGEEALYSLKHGKAKDPVRQPFALKPGEPLRMTLFIDKICFEAFVNDRICYDRAIHACDHTGKALALPNSGDLGIAVFAQGGEAVVKSLDVWHMNPIKTTTY
jgi:beta-fructofuranosidase